MDRHLLCLCLLLLRLGSAQTETCDGLGDPSEGDPELGSMSLLQIDVATLPSTAKKECFNFMHIPKTGGTSIDSANLHLPAGERVFDSLMLQTYMRVAAKWDIGFGEDLGQVYDKSHQDMITYGTFLFVNHDAYHVLDLGSGDICEDLHVPPSQSAGIALYYQECTTFCAVREPLSRFWSAFKMLFFDCDPLAIEKQTARVLASLSTHPYGYNCFLVPQVESVYGVANKSVAKQQYCDIILHQENLTEEFAALMAAQGQTLQLPAEDLMSSWTDHCKLPVDALTAKTKQMVYEHFRADYEAFGYDKPEF
mmetsp:Transcript_6657/g.12065  ORF Transcript_6657/g.12065 Transcript_6657/m.12065 type:complete len:309 (-) Transcript_6657:7-933(-)